MSQHGRFLIGTLGSIGNLTIHGLIRTIHVLGTEHTGIVRNFQGIVSNEKIIIAIMI